MQMIKNNIVRCLLKALQFWHFFLIPSILGTIDGFGQPDLSPVVSKVPGDASEHT